MQTQSFLPINIYSDSFFLKKIEFNFGSNFESNFGSSPWVQSMFCTMPIPSGPVFLFRVQYRQCIVKLTSEQLEKTGWVVT